MIKAKNKYYTKQETTDSEKKVGERKREYEKIRDDMGARK